MPRQENAESPGELAENQSKPRGQRKALFVVAGSQLLVLTLWFSASAAAPQLEADWGLTSGETAGLTLAVQIGFVLGAIGSAIFAIADVIPGEAALSGFRRSSERVQTWHSSLLARAMWKWRFFSA